MNEENLSATQPTNIAPPSVEDTSPIRVTPAPEATPPKKKKRRGWMKTAGMILLGLMLILLVSGFLGYRNGINRRINLESEQRALLTAEQFTLGVLDMEAGNYARARQRFEYVIGLDPSYPGVTDKLAEVLLIENVTATPTAAPTPTEIPITPTPDTRAVEELFTKANGHIANKEWTEAIETAEEIRKRDPEFYPLKVDGILYLSLRMRGIQKIGLGSLEGGIYDLTLAESFGVLDTEADGWRNWARLYLTGASFWDVDWPQAINYFQELASITPNLHDGSGWSAAQRYVDALVGYAESLEAQGYWCDVDELYDQAFQYTGNAIYQEMMITAQGNCQ